jgi:hypothetical protein
MALQLGVIACTWGCTRERDRDPVPRDTLSLAPLADSSAVPMLDDSAHQSQAGALPNRLATRNGTGPADSARTGRERHRSARPVRKRAAAAAAERAVPDTTTRDTTTRATTTPDTAAPERAAPDTGVQAYAPAPRDTSVDARAAVGDSIIPAATPVAGAADSSSSAPSATPISPAATVSTPAPTDSTARAPDPMAEVPRATPAGTPSDALPAGTQVRAILNDSITSLRNSVGQRVSAVVSGDLRAADGLAVLPSGAVVHLTIERLAPARTRSAKDGELVLRADSIVAAGHAYPVDASLQPIPHELRGRGVTAGEVEKVGAGAAAGAVVGGVVTGKTKGAVVGGAVGAVGGAVVAAQTASRDVVVSPRTLITLVLRSPVARATR